MSGIAFNDLLHLAGIAPEEVNVMLHSPNEGRGDLQALLPSLARTRRPAVEAYCAYHSAGAERTLMNGRPLIAVFAKAAREREFGRSRMVFIGMFRNEGCRRRSHVELMADPEIRWLYERFGAASWFATGRADLHHRWFDLTPVDALSDLQGRLLILVRLSPNYVRRGENLDAPVAMGAATVQEMPPGWAAKLREWRGIYLITDESDGARYVGAAYGEENLVGRWRAHVAGERGATVGLADRDPSTFRFAILERVSPDMPVEDVTALEQTWMTRLHTRSHGLNR